MSRAFSAFAAKTAGAVGHWSAFVLALSVVVAWVVGGFFFGFNDPVYQLYINSGTTIVTFLMVFLLANAENKGTKAVEVKLDALALAIKEANNQVVGIEEADEEELEEIRQQQHADAGNPFRNTERTSRVPGAS